VAIMLPNVPHFCISYYAALYIGAVVIPLNFLNSPEEISRQLEECDVKAFILWQGFSHFSDHIPSQCQTFVLGDHIPAGSHSLTKVLSSSAPLTTPEHVNDDDLAVINYTSGIAHVALGAELTHGALAANTTICKDMFPLESIDRVLTVLPLFHPMGQSFVMHTALTSGASIILLPRVSSHDILSATEKHKATFLVLVPDALKALNQEEPQTSFPELRYCISYGGLLTDETMHEFENIYDTLVLKAYGLTEAGALVAATRAHLERRTNSVGIPLMGVELQIRDSRGNILHPNQNGEIFVKSPGLMRKYINNTEETEKRFVDGWLRTGDVGYLDLEHYLYILDRKDNIISKGGFEIYPKEIENLLLEFPGIEQVAVVGINDYVYGQEVKAFIVMKDGAECKWEDLYGFCKNSLPLYKCPQYIEFVDEIPKSSTGRVLKRILRKQKSTEKKNEARIKEKEKNQ